MACINHPNSPICQDVTYESVTAICQEVADDAAQTAGNNDQTFTGQNWRQVYDECIGRGRG